MSAIPPIARETQIVSAAARVHRMRVARGACWVIVSALAVGGLLTLLDAVAWLPAWVRGIGLAAWVTGIGVLVWRLVARRIPPDPNTVPLDARRELPGNLRAAAAAAFVLAAALLATAWVPGASEHVRRVALPWSGKSAPPSFRVKVTSGEPVVRRGDSVTLSAYGERIAAPAAPEGATLICRDPNGAELRIPMRRDAGGAFHATRGEVDRSFQYRVEVGSASSDWHSVAVLDPVELTGQSKTIVVPPRYAAESGRQVKSGFVSFEAHQYADVELQLHFSRPASTAFLEWQEGGASLELIPLAIAPDHLTGRASMRLARDGNLTAVTIAEEGGKTLRTASTIRIEVKPDAPPRFERMIGVATRPRTARPSSRISIEFTAIDDLAVGSATFEYVIGSDQSKPIRLPIPLDRAGSTRAVGQVDFALPSQEGDTVRFRVRVSDTRRLDDPELVPQEAVFPESGWSVVRIDESAPPLDEQDVLSQRNALADVLVNALDELKKGQNEIGALRIATADRSSLPLEESVRLSNIRASTRKLADTIRAAARETALAPRLRLLAEAVGEIAEQPLKNADEALRRCATDNPAHRRVAFTAAIELLGDAIGRIDRHLAFNNRIAQARLDCLWIASLTAEQSALAGRALNEDAQPEELARRQRELRGRLEALVGRSPPLHNARIIANDRRILHNLAASRELAERLGELDAAIRNLTIDVRNELLRAAAEEQEAIVAAATMLTKRADVAARLASVSLPAVALFTRIADLIAVGQTVDALTELEARAQTLEAIAAAIEKWSSESHDPRVAARHLALWQEDIQWRFRIATKQNAILFDALPAATRETFRREQLAIHKAILALKLPPNSQLKKTRDEIGQRATDAADSLAGKGTSADDAMKVVVDGLNRLAGAIPTISERLTKARRDFQKLFQSQEAIQAAVEQAVRGNETAKRLPALADSQINQMNRFLGLDIPGSESRANGIRAALAAAALDLRDGLPSESLASQHWLRRELDRQRMALEGITAPDDRAEELARKVQAIAATVAGLGPHPTAKQLEAPAAAAQELAQQIALFATPPEAASLANEARNAAQLLETAARDAVRKPDDYRQRLRNATAAMTRLADRLIGAEPDLDRVRRLSAYRWSAWDEARKYLGKPPSADVSAEASRQLVREAEELTFTRVGFAGQSLKKRILDQYSRLRDRANPDRMAGLQKTLAESLGELAALMADVPDLATPIPRVQTDPPATDADDYLPTPALAAKFRELADQQRALRHHISSISELVRKRTRPADTNPLAKASELQNRLAETIEDFASKLAAEKPPAAQAVRDAATSARRAASLLAVGMWTSANESAARAAQLLREAGSRYVPLEKAATDLAARQDAIRTSMGAKAPAPGVVAVQQQTRGAELARRAAELAKDFLETARANASREALPAALDHGADELAAAEKLIVDATQKAAEGMPEAASNLHGEAIRRLAASAEKVAVLLPKPSTLMEVEPTAIDSAILLERAESAMRRAVEELNAKADRKAAAKTMRIVADSLTAAMKARIELIGK